MNFLFVTPKYTRRGQFYHFNFGLAYVSSYMKHRGFKVSCLNCCHYDEPIEQQLSECIADKKIDVVCTGGMAIDFNNINEILDKAKLIKPEIITVVGGAIVSSDPKLALENMQIDFGVIGEGEETMAELADALSNGRDVSNIKGLTFFDTKNNLITAEPREPIADLDALPFPDYEGFEYGYHLSTYTPDCHLYYHTILDEPRPGKIITSRACPFNCTFCYHQLGKKYRQRSLDNVFKEIDYLVEKYNINTLMLLDEILGIDKARIYEFAKRIKKYNMKWMPILRVETIDKQVLEALKESGAYLISYGIENVNDEILRSMQKKITRVQIEQALKLTKEAQIGIQAGILFGDVAETEETIKESIDWWLKHLNYGLLLTMIITLPDSSLYRHAIAEGLIKDKLQYMKDRFPIVNLTKLSDEKFRELRDFVCNYINDEKYIIVGEVVSLKEESQEHLWKFFPDLRKYYSQKIFSIKVKCPECRRVSEYKNMRRCRDVFSISSEYFPILCRNCYMLLWIRAKEAYRFYNFIIIKTINIVGFFINKHPVIKSLYGKICKNIYIMRYIMRNEIVREKKLIKTLMKGQPNNIIKNNKPFIKRSFCFNWLPQLPDWVCTRGHIAAKERFLRKISTAYAYEVLNECPLCGANIFHLIARQERYGISVSVVICEHCSLLFNNPRLDKESMFDHYKTEARALEYGDGSDVHESIFSLQREKGPRIMNFLNSTGNQKKFKYIAEIGCGEGGILSYFNEFYDKVVGFELDEDAVIWGQRKGLNIQCATFSERGSSQNFDLIICEQILEHILDIEEELKTLSTPQRNGDWLYVGLPGLFNFGVHYTHNFISYLEYQHVYHFTLYTLERLLSKYRYKLLKGNEIIQALFEKVDDGKEITLKTPRTSLAEILTFLSAEEQLFKKQKKTLRPYINYLKNWILFKVAHGA